MVKTRLYKEVADEELMRLATCSTHHNLITLVCLFVRGVLSNLEYFLTLKEVCVCYITLKGDD